MRTKVQAMMKRMCMTMQLLLQTPRNRQRAGLFSAADLVDADTGGCYVQGWTPPPPSPPL